MQFKKKINTKRLKFSCNIQSPEYYRYNINFEKVYLCKSRTINVSKIYWVFDLTEFVKNIKTNKSNKFISL